MILIIWSDKPARPRATEKRLNNCEHSWFMGLLTPYGAADIVIVQFGHKQPEPDIGL